MVFAAFFLPSAPSLADELPFDFFQATHLLGISQNSALSNLAGSLRSGGFETSAGTKVSFDRWYSSKWTDTNASFLTQVTPSFGFLWGVSTGERGEKYKIDPSFKYGFLYVHTFSTESHLSFEATTIVGGRLKERSCTADYGEIGGVQDVNCRLAASEMEPAKTLEYLINQPPPNKTQVALRYSLNF